MTPALPDAWLHSLAPRCRHTFKNPRSIWSFPLVIKIFSPSTLVVIYCPGSAISYSNATKLHDLENI